jgi:hypothetical protein
VISLGLNTFGGNIVIKVFIMVGSMMSHFTFI